jgi:hypothetical protein
MNRTTKAIIWTFVFLLLLLAVDQFLLRVDFAQPQMRIVRSFYLDFRQRLLTLGGSSAPDSVDEIIESERRGVTPAQTPQRKTAASPRYLYVDQDGTLQFADSLEEIPPALRKGAQRLED